MAVHDPLAERALLVRATINQGEHLTIASAKHRHVALSCRDPSRAALGDILDRADIMPGMLDVKRVNGHCAAIPIGSWAMGLNS